MHIPDYIPQDLPTSARQIIRDNYGDDFKTYIIRRQNGSRVEGRIYRITKEELGFIDDWELGEFAWYEQNRGIAQMEIEKLMPQNAACGRQPRHLIGVPEPTGCVCVAGALIVERSLNWTLEGGVNLELSTPQGEHLY